MTTILKENSIVEKTMACNVCKHNNNNNNNNGGKSGDNTDRPLPDSRSDAPDSNAEDDYHQNLLSLIGLPPPSPQIATAATRSKSRSSPRKQSHKKIKEGGLSTTITSQSTAEGQAATKRTRQRSQRNRRRGRQSLSLRESKTSKKNMLTESISSAPTKQALDDTHIGAGSRSYRTNNTVASSSNLPLSKSPRPQRKASLSTVASALRAGREDSSTDAIIGGIINKSSSSSQECSEKESINNNISNSNNKHTPIVPSTPRRRTRRSRRAVSLRESRPNKNKILLGAENERVKDDTHITMRRRRTQQLLSLEEDDENDDAATTMKTTKITEFSLKEEDSGGADNDENVSNNHSPANTKEAVRLNNNKEGSCSLVEGKISEDGEKEEEVVIDDPATGTVWIRSPGCPKPHLELKIAKMTEIGVQQAPQKRALMQRYFRRSSVKF